MARNKKFFSIKIPFITSIAIKKETFSSLCGLIMVGAGLVMLGSFFASGEMTVALRTFLLEKFGALSITIPALFILAGTHFFNSKKVKIIKPQSTFGLFFLFIAFIGALRSGSIGDGIVSNLSRDFSSFGAFVILTVTGVMGFVLFFNSSIDVFMVVMIDGMKSFLAGFNRLTNRDPQTDQQGHSILGSMKGEFISKILPKPGMQPNVPPQAQQGNQAQQNQAQAMAASDLHIRKVATPSGGWKFPPYDLLQDVSSQKADTGDIKLNSQIIETTLSSFGIRAKVEEINEGPTITQYALEIVMGTKLSKILALSNDLASALASPTGQIRIEAPIPGKSLVGIEIPNRRSEIVTLKRMLTSPQMHQDHHPLLVPLGLDVSGNPVVGNIAKMPHVLIAGTTGAGKSVLLNSWICSIMYRATREQVQMILVDPKRVELTGYNGIPHLMTEVIVEPKKIVSALQWTVKQMEERYKKFAEVGSRNLESYNDRPGVEKLPYILFVIDELADLMIFAPREAEEAITRIAQMARATGIHLILATQRPSVDVITGLMKANIPSRIAFNVPSLIDSRVVLDMPGAEKLVGKGDMLYLPSDQAKPNRIQGPLISDKDVNSVVNFLKKQAPVVHYTEEITEMEFEPNVAGKGRGMVTTGASGSRDPLLEKAIEIFTMAGKASTSLLQRKLSVGYSKAAKIIDALEAEGYIGPGQGSKGREFYPQPIRTMQNEGGMGIGMTHGGGMDAGMMGGGMSGGMGGGSVSGSTGAGGGTTGMGNTGAAGSTGSVGSADDFPDLSRDIARASQESDEI